LVLALLTLVMLGFALVPLLRRRAPRADRADYDLLVYKRQLDEVARERERGLFTEAEAAAARLEIERRMLAVADEPGEAQTGDSRFRMIAAVVVAAVLPLAGFLLYLELGAPGTPDQPLAERRAAAPQGAEQPMQPDIETLIARLAERVEADPADLEGWLRLGRAYAMTGRPAPAVEAFEHALGLEERPDILAEYGEALVLLHGEQVVEPAREAFRKALAGAPREPRARYYLALGAAQDGDWQAAFDGWVALARDSAADAPWLPVVREQIAEAAGQLGIDPAGLELDLEAAPARPAPSEAERQAIEAMSPEDRAAMIGGMVENLAARLEQEPRNLEGWTMLIRSYGVLGDTPAAKAALGKARGIFADAPDALAQLDRLAEDLGYE